MKITYFSEFFIIYQAASDAQLQRESTSLGLLKKNLDEFIRGLFKGKLNSVLVGRLNTMLNIPTNKHHFTGIFAKFDGNEKIEIDATELKKDFVASYKDQIDDEAEDCDIDDDCIFKLIEKLITENSSSKKENPNLQNASSQSRIMQQFLQQAPQKTFEEVGYEYNRGHMGLSSSFLEACLEGGFMLTQSAYPHDADDLSRCILYLEDYLRRKNLTDLTSIEKNMMSKASGEWHGIMKHLTELREAVRTNLPPQQLTEFLRQCMNEGIEDKSSQELTSDETLELAKLLGKEKEGHYTHTLFNYDLENKSLSFANKLIQEFTTRGYNILFRHERGWSKLTVDDTPRLLSKADYTHQQKILEFTKREVEATETNQQTPQR